MKLPTHLSLRTYLLISYLGLVLILTLGMWAIADRFMDRLTDHALADADGAVKKVTAANQQLAEGILTRVGEYIIKDKAEDVARELSYVLAGKKNYQYAQIRADAKIRRIAIQTITTPQGVAGYTDVYDQKGYILFHPDPQVEGRNQLDWQDEYPETTEMIKRSLTENNVSGYFTFFDRAKKERMRYSVRVHVPGTPFIVGAIVNIDEFFLPTKLKMEQANREIMAKAKGEIERHHLAMNRQIRMGGLIAGSSLALVGILFGLWFAATISRPIYRLRDGVRQIGEGDFSVAVPATGFKEVVHLAESFNELGQQLTEYIEKRDFIRDTFGRYVTQEVVRKLLEDKGALELGGETREVSIIMSDLRGFTALTADMHPQEVITFLNRYLGKMIEILVDYRAVIDEIVGDGILAFFGAPEPMSDHPVRAVACALQMQAAMDEINFLNQAEGMPHLEMGVGVDTGSVVVGNIGSEKRAKYSVVGAHVNFTSRIESYAVGGQVLISPSTYERVQDLIEVGDTIRAEMKGVPEPATLYEVMAIGGPYHIRLKERRDTLMPLPEKVPVRLQRIREKIVTGAMTGWITHMCETAAIVVHEGELGEWEDVRLRLLDEKEAEIPGKIYGKVVAVKPAGDNLQEAEIRFTSVSPEIYRIIPQASGGT